MTLRTNDLAGFLRAKGFLQAMLANEVDQQTAITVASLDDVDDPIAVVSTLYALAAITVVALRTLAPDGDVDQVLDDIVGQLIGRPE